MPEPTLAVPPLDYADPAVHAVLHAVTNDPSGLCEYLARGHNTTALAVEYGRVAALGDIVCGSPEMAWDFVRAVRVADAARYGRAVARLGDASGWDVGAVDPDDHVLPLDGHVLAVAQALLELDGEDELQAAVAVLWAALADGTLTLDAHGA